MPSDEQIEDGTPAAHVYPYEIGDPPLSDEALREAVMVLMCGMPVIIECVSVAQAKLAEDLIRAAAGMRGQQ